MSFGRLLYEMFRDRSGRTVFLASFLLGLVMVLTGPVNGQEASTDWVLQKGKDIRLHAHHKPLLRIEGDVVSGSTGCNSFTAKLSLRSNKRIAIEDISLTRKMCSHRRSRVEAAVVHAMEHTTFMEVHGQLLRFLSAKRRPLLVWIRNSKLAPRRATLGTQIYWKIIVHEMKGQANRQSLLVWSNHKSNPRQA